MSDGKIPGRYEVALNKVNDLAKTGGALAIALESYSKVDYTSDYFLWNTNESMNNLEALNEINALTPFVSHKWRKTQNAIFDIHREKEIMEISDVNEHSSGMYHEILHETQDIEQAYLILDQELAKIDETLRNNFEFSIGEPHKQFRYVSPPNERGYRVKAD